MNKRIFPLITSESNLPFFVAGVGLYNHQSHIKRIKGFQYYSWLYCEDGQGLLIINSTEYVIDKNMGFFIRPGIPHEYYALKEPWTVHWICFSGDYSGTLLDTLGFGHFGVYYLTESKYITWLLNSIYTTACTKSLDKGYQCSALLYTFLLEMKKVISEKGIPPKVVIHRQVEDVINFMEDNYSKDISLKDISDYIQVSAQYLCRIFKHEVHTSPIEYLIKIRIQKAKELMEEKNVTIKEIINLTGFKDASYFCSVFKAREGMTPMQFKRINYPDQ